MQTKRPNILIVVADCARSSSWIGPGRATATPNLDRLACDGVTFPVCIAEKSCTTPAFASLLTGLYSPRHGVQFVFGYRLGEQIPLLTRVLADQGYHTYAEVSGPLLPEMGLDRGFERYEYRAPCDYLDTAWGDRLLERLRSGHYRSPWFILLHLWELHLPRRLLPEFDRGEYGRERYERAVSCLDAQLGRLMHAAGDDTLTVFTGDHGEKTDSETFPPGAAVDYVRNLLGLDQMAASDGDPPLYQLAWTAGPSVMNQFYAQLVPAVKDLNLRGICRRPPPGRWARVWRKLRILRLAPWLGLRDLLALGAPIKLTEMLKRRGLLDEARSRAKVERLARSMGRQSMIDMHVRMWMSNYENNYRNGHGVHVYDWLVNVPLVLRWPAGLPAGTAYPRMVRQPDILPTILDLVGVDRNRFDGTDGQSFADLIRGRPWDEHPAYLSITGVPGDLELRGVRTPRYKYTFGPRNPEMPEELYDLACDPGESSNLAAGKPDVCAELRRMADRLATSGPPAPDSWMTLSDEEMAVAERRLHDLGYL